MDQNKEKIKSPHAIFFDLDDTLYKTEIPHQKAINKVYKNFSQDLGIGKENLHQIYIKSRKETKLSLGNTASSHSKLIYFQKMLEKVKFKGIPSKAIELESLYWNTYLNEINSERKLVDLFRDISERKINIGIITDLTAQVQMKKLIKLGIENYINVIVTSEEAGLDKPNFSCFSLANEKLNPENKKYSYWMVGNDVTKDLIGAKVELEAKTFLVNYPKNNLHNTSVDYYLNNILDLKDFL